MTLQDLLEKRPKIQKHPASSELLSHSLGDGPLNYINQRVSEDSNTLETGAGVSTILFALKKTNHTCIVPDEGEVERILEYCGRHRISTEKIMFHIDRSEDILPRLGENNRLDLVLIDGNHAFPIPFIDWYYVSPQVKVGGLMVIDDTNIWTGGVLKQFLLSEPEWELERDFGKTVVLAKTGEGGERKGWRRQLFVLRNSNVSLEVGQRRYAVELWRHGRLLRLSSKVLQLYWTRLRYVLSRVKRRVLGMYGWGCQPGSGDVPR